MNVQGIILWRRFFSGMAYTAMQSVFFIYLQYEKGFETAQIACAFSLLVFTSQAFSLFAGSWGDRFGRMNIMMLGCLLDVIAYLLLLFSSSYGVLFLTTFLFGFGSTLFSTNARAFMLSASTNEYREKTKSQGRFLMISSMASMVAPLLALPFIYFHQEEWLIWLSASIEMAMFAFMLLSMPKTECHYKFERFHFSQFKEILTKQFVFAHLLLFIPLGIASSFYVIFPYIFTNLLDHPEIIPIAFFVNNLIAVLLQSRFSRHINLGVVKLSYIAPMLVMALFFSWFYVLENLSILMAFSYLLIFAVISLYANTALANILVCFDRGENQGLMFGMSKLILSITTAIVMNGLPYFFLVGSASSE